MSIFFSEDVLRQHPLLPVVCKSCGYQMVLKHDTQLDKALVDSTYLHEAYLELMLLERTKSLFARFPESRYALKVNKEQLQPKQSLCTGKDPEFESALASDPELSRFLRTSVFHLPSRRRGVTELIAQLEKSDFAAIHCPVCTAGIFRLPEGFLK